MAIKIQWGEDGLPFAVCETATEAVELLKQGKLEPASSNGTQHRAKPAQEQASKPQNAEDKTTVVLENISPKAKKLLLALLNHTQGVDTDTLGAELGISGSSIGGLFASISKVAKAQSFKIEQLVKSEVKRGPDKRSYRWLLPTKLLADHKPKI
jgi:hypothetical protein